MSPVIASNEESRTNRVPIAAQPVAIYPNVVISERDDVSFGMLDPRVACRRDPGLGFANDA